MSITSFTRPAFVGAAALTAVVALTGCSGLFGGGADRDDETGQVVETASDSVFSVKVGDCLNEPQGTEISDVELVPCDQPHDYEVFAEHELPEGDFPSDVDTLAQDYCLPEFEKFIGQAYDTSSIELTWFSPTQTGWDQQDDRLIQCIVTDPAGQTTGSLEGSKK